LLRVLATRTLERLGSTTPIRLDLCVIASTQRPLDDLVESGAFRRDLFFRINVFTLQLRTLREHRARIVPLFSLFVEAFAHEVGHSAQAISSDSRQVLLTHDWPGNIRELKSAAKRFVLGFPLLGAEPINGHDPATGLKSQLRVIEKVLIQESLKRHKNNIGAASQELDIPRRTLYHRIKNLDVKDESTDRS
ncbi:sigma 54-interacting transcriptional regulator, partial [Pseudomonas rossensis]|uniref:sigma 54-interacting transcriptional regulator n=1 Tax=Pseudomonas rossensis TaxID=2305471 RepID=UPI003261CEF0